MSSPPEPAHRNRLADATSPYLLQHAHNPVDWWQWGAEAFAEAKAGNKPILLSVGYAACHWCHVMAHEWFEDEATARVMNELFVNIKVDREERPDIDQIYMNALHLLGEQGGWPLTMFLTPAGEPVWGGTYFPKESRFGRPAFVDVLREVARLFREEPDKIEQNRAALLARLAEKARPEGKVDDRRSRSSTPPRAQIGNMFDAVNGGLRGAPKFPQPAILEMLWRAGTAHAATRASSRRVEHSLERMSEGGIYDHLGGGFSRYSVDERWLVPHFEKMLYDNAQLLELLALAFAAQRQPAVRAARARDGRLARARDDDEGGRLLPPRSTPTRKARRASSTSGRKTEIDRAARRRMPASSSPRQYDVSDEGNFEGHNILNRLQWRTAQRRRRRGAARLAMLREKLLACATSACGPGSTTRCWPTGTG